MMRKLLLLFLLVVLTVCGFGQTERVKTYTSVEEAMLEPDKVRELNLTNDTTLEILPVSILKLVNLEEIDLEDIPKLNFNRSMQLIAQLPNLKRLSLYRCNIVSVDRILRGFDALEELTITEAHFKKLPIEVLSMKKLKEVDLSENPQLDWDITFNLLSNLQQLRSLCIEDCDLYRLSKEIEKLNCLEELDLAGNKLTKFPETLKKLKRLKHLHLFSNQLTNIPLKTGDLPNLVDINLCYNKFKVFPTDLSVLPKLRKIIIWYTPITTIPKEIKRFDKLEILILENTQLKAIPAEFAYLKNLRELSLRHDNLTAKDMAPIYKLTNLKKLNLYQNKINKITDQIGGLKNLTDLTLAENPLLTQLPRAISKLKNIKIFQIGYYNAFDWAEAVSIMSKLPNLETVGMFKMQIKTMPTGFEKLTQVKQFYLNYNLFDSVERERIQKMLPNAKMSFD